MAMSNLVHRTEYQSYLLGKSDTLHILDGQMQDNIYHWDAIPASEIKDALYIRLACLLPSEDPDAEPVLEIVSGKARDLKLTYECISYTYLSSNWGTTERESPQDDIHVSHLNSIGYSLLVRITCNGQAMFVSQTLVDALKSLRHCSTSRRLWIDQICINQGDVAERNSQVMRMFEIFGSAESTILWLGDGDDSTEQALTLIRKLSQAYLKPANDKLYLTPEINTVKDLNQLTTDIPSFLSPEWEKVCQIFQRPALQRIWVTQEVCISNEIIVRCGTKEVPWEYLVATSLVLSNDLLKFVAGDWRKLLTDRSTFGCIAVLSMNGLREKLLKDEALDFGDLMRAQGMFGVSDPRDVLNARLGMLNVGRKDEDRIKVYADYSSGVREVFTVVSQLLIAGDQSLSALALKPSAVQPHHRTSSGDHDLPSWIPDFAALDYPYLTGLNILARQNLYNAARGTSLVDQLDIGEFRLTIRSRLLDRIKFTSRQSQGLPADVLAEQTPSGSRSLSNLLFWTSFASINISPDRPTYPTGETWLSAFSKTFLLGITDLSEFVEDGQAPPDEYYVLFFCWVSVFLLSADSTNWQRAANPILAEMIKKACDVGVMSQNPDTGSFTVEPLPLNLVGSLLSRYDRYLDRLQMFVTEQGFFGFCRDDAQAGDVLCLFPSTEIPMVIRPADPEILIERANRMEHYSDPNSEEYHDPDSIRQLAESGRLYTLVGGGAYFHGAMNGELVGDIETWEGICIY